MLRKYNCQYYELPESKTIEEAYRSRFIYDLENEEWNDNVTQWSLSKEEVIRRVRENDGVYTMLFEHLEKQADGNVMKNKQTLYIENELVDEEHYMHVPYPIFLRIDHQGRPCFICIGAGIR
jgi:hypothetical protein